MIKYIIFREDVDSTVYELRNSIEEEKILQYDFGKELLFVRFRFPSKSDGSHLNHKVLTLNGLPNMRSIMALRKIGHIDNWSFYSKWDHPITKLDTLKLTKSTWHQNAVNELQNILIDRFLNLKLTEEAFYAFRNLIIQSDKLSLKLLSELILIIASSIASPYKNDKSTFRIAFRSVLIKTQIPNGITKWDGEYHYIFNSFIRNQIEFGRKWDIDDLFITIDKLIMSIVNRGINNIESIYDIQKLCLHKVNISDYWLGKEQIDKLTILLNNTSLSLEEIRNKMTYSTSYNKCFVSYSTKDEEFVNKLYEDLIKKGVNCWYAPKDIMPGKKVHDQLQEAIENRDKVIVVLSESSMNSEWVKTEIANARSREVKEKCNLLIPIRLVPFDNITSWQYFDADIGKDSAKEIREYFIPDFTDWNNSKAYFQNFGKLLIALEKEVQNDL